MKKKSSLKMKGFSRSQMKRILSLFGIVVILAAIPLTINLAKNFKLYKPFASEITYTNLVLNPGFESGTDIKPSDWQYISSSVDNPISWISDDVHFGNKAMKLTMTKPELAPYNYIGLSSNWFKVTPGALIEASAWWKASDITYVKLNNYVGWYHIRIQLQAYDETKTNQLKVWNFGGQEGSVNTWNKVAGNLIVPENTGYMRIQVWLNHATGTLWIDDIVVNETKIRPQPGETSSQPVVIPQPWIMNTTNSSLPLGTIVGVNLFNETNLQEELLEYFSGIGKSIVFLSDNDPKLKQYTTIIKLGDGSNQEIAKQFKSKFRGKSISELGQEGYFFSVKKDGPNRIYLAANTARGRFYAIQTLKQLIKNDSVFVVDIFDKPTVEKRGITLPAEWWSTDKTKVVQGSAEVKYNFIWYQGELFSYKLATSWRNPFTEEDKVLMRSQNDLCNKHYIDCYFSFRPRGVSAPLIYSSDTDINTIVNKMDVMYNQGIRNFGLSFDDLETNGESILLSSQDIAKFNNDIGAAHKHFITEVFNRMKQRHSDIKFGLVPLRYQRSNNYASKSKDYLRQIAGIPQEIDIMSSEYYDNDINMFNSLTNRKVNVWDNLYAFTYSNKAEPQYVLPFVNPAMWTDTNITSKISGITFLPRTFKAEQSAGVSWYTMADFAWAPDRYNADTSFQKAVNR